MAKSLQEVLGEYARLADARRDEMAKRDAARQEAERAIPAVVSTTIVPALDAVSAFLENHGCASTEAAPPPRPGELRGIGFIVPSAELDTSPTAARIWIEEASNGKVTVVAATFLGERIEGQKRFGAEHWREVTRDRLDNILAEALEFILVTERERPAF
jgi:hypothetical protein